MGRSKISVTPKLIFSLGVKSDSEIARGLGVRKQTVQQLRSKLGLVGIQDGRPIDWTPEMIAQLGRRTDVDLFCEWGISELALRIKRAELGIPALGRTNPPTFRHQRKPR